MSSEGRKEKEGKKSEDMSVFPYANMEVMKALSTSLQLALPPVTLCSSFVPFPTPLYSSSSIPLKWELATRKGKEERVKRGRSSQATIQDAYNAQRREVSLYSREFQEGQEEESTRYYGKHGEVRNVERRSFRQRSDARVEVIRKEDEQALRLYSTELSEGEGVRRCEGLPCV